METKRFPIIELRPYQVEAWRGISKEGVKESFLVWHRRAGKDLFCLQYLIAQAIQRKGNYWYVLPQQNQVRRAIWEGHITSTGQRYIDTIPKEWILKRYDSEMKLVLANPDGSEGSIISFVGSDNYDSLVGSGINGLVMSEFALSKPDAYRLAIRPMLMESNGWAILNTTPRGHNHAYKMLQAMKEDPTCYTSVLTVEDTGVVDVSVIDKERTRGTPEEIIQQEWYCSFEGAIHGAYYADMLRLAKVGDYPYDPRYPVHTCWDLGVSDSMAIWFVQFIDGSIRLIDHYEASTYGLGHYVNIINGKNYNYAGHHLPHDGTHRQLTSTEKAQSIQGQLLALGLNRVDVIPRTNDVYSDIQQVRSILPLCQFNRETTNQGYEAILNYRREWDEDAQCFKNNPLHDWTSHSCLTGDSLVTMKDGKTKQIKDVKRGEYISIDGHSFKVLKSGMTKISETITITLANGRKIRCTPDHKIFTIRGLTRADELRYNDVIATEENRLWTHLLKSKTNLREEVISCTKESNTGGGKTDNGMSHKSVESKQCCTTCCTGMETEDTNCTLLMEIRKILVQAIGNIEREATILQQTESTDCLTKKDSTRKKMAIGGAKCTDRCTDMCGDTTTGIFQNIATYTTKMATKTTIKLKTFAYLQTLNTLKCILRLINGLVVRKTGSNLFLFKKKQNYGIQAKKVENGTVYTGSIVGKTESLLKRFAQSVVKSISLTTKGEVNTAQHYASNVISITTNKNKVPVYDITVEKAHCFYANGVLVSNCDAFRIIPKILRQTNSRISWENIESSLEW